MRVHPTCSLWQMGTPPPYQGCITQGQNKPSTIILYICWRYKAKNSGPSRKISSCTLRRRWKVGRQYSLVRESSVSRDLTKKKSSINEPLRSKRECQDRGYGLSKKLINIVLVFVISCWGALANYLLYFLKKKYLAPLLFHFL